MQNFFPKYRNALLHISFWCVYLSFSLYRISSKVPKEEYDLLKVLTFVLIQVIMIMAIAYLNYFIFLPRWLKHKNFLRYLLEFMVPFILFVTLRINLERYIIDGFTHREGYFYSTIFTVQVAAITLFIVIFVGMLRFAVDWFELEAKKKEVENERLYAELNFLKAQINPHFLFNTLNNLYYLAYSHSPNTTEVISKLSQMMRYMIYDSNHPKVLLSKEIDYMQNYISLEKLRLNNDIPIDFDIKGNIETASIAPLIFITFLENAFKHGVSNNNSQSWVAVKINIEKDSCIYVVENSKIPKSLDSKEDKSGIGLLNVKRRLELSYPGNYELNIEDLKNKYRVELKIKLI
jgi:two-component system, LytTR family, sensor histidine kinase AlgZ